MVAATRVAAEDTLQPVEVGSTVAVLPVVGSTVVAAVLAAADAANRQEGGT